jgi:hypothetical protein
MMDYLSKTISTTASFALTIIKHGTSKMKNVTYAGKLFQIVKIVHKEEYVINVSQDFIYLHQGLNV